jgi:DNA polymerase/3'-5' exonuclease PolX
LTGHVATLVSPVPWDSLQEAQSVPFVGDRLANKIFEIVSTGQLRRLENVDKEKERIVEMFKDIHGVGQVTAQQFYAQVHLTPHVLSRQPICYQMSRTIETKATFSSRI